MYPTLQSAFNIKHCWSYHRTCRLQIITTHPFILTTTLDFTQYLSKSVNSLKHIIITLVHQQKTTRIYFELNISWKQLKRNENNTCPNFFYTIHAFLWRRSQKRAPPLIPKRQSNQRQKNGLASRRKKPPGLCSHPFWVWHKNFKDFFQKYMRVIAFLISLFDIEYLIASLRYESVHVRWRSINRQFFWFDAIRCHVILVPFSMALNIIGALFWRKHFKNSAITYYAV